MTYLFSDAYATITDTGAIHNATVTVKYNNLEYSNPASPALISTKVVYDNVIANVYRISDRVSSDISLSTYASVDVVPLFIDYRGSLRHNITGDVDVYAYDTTATPVVE